jgi:hypothetical protein
LSGHVVIGASGVTSERTSLPPSTPPSPFALPPSHDAVAHAAIADAAHKKAQALRTMRRFYQVGRS